MHSFWVQKVRYSLKKGLFFGYKSIKCKRLAWPDPVDALTLSDVSMGYNGREANGQRRAGTMNAVEAYNNRIQENGVFSPTSKTDNPLRAMHPPIYGPALSQCRACRFPFH